MKRVVIIFCISLSCLLASQQVRSQGVNFANNLTWTQVKEKAKEEHKYIFVDCYATWCGPCKMMDETVYPQKAVGDYYNIQFISVKVQMDKTNTDDSLIKAWYHDAGKLQSQYSVNSFPTFLFFAPDGTPVHKVSGTMEEEKFISVGKDAQNPDRQYYSILKNFRAGVLDTSELKGLARSFRYSDKILAAKIAEDYLSRIPEKDLGEPENLQFMMEMNEMEPVQKMVAKYLRNESLVDVSSNKNVLSLINSYNKVAAVQNIIYDYLSKLNKSDLALKNSRILFSIFKTVPRVKEVAEDYISQKLTSNEIFTKDNIPFINTFTFSTRDRGFEVFYHYPDKIDSVQEVKGYAKALLDKIIIKEEITPLIDAVKKSGGIIDWDKVGDDITNKYGEGYSQRTLRSSKPQYYGIKKDWVNYTQSLINAIEFLEPKKLGFFSLNNNAWSIFLYSNNKTELEKALRWSEISIEIIDQKSIDLVGTLYDTKASLLYKLGRTTDAMVAENKAIESSNTLDRKKGLLATLVKMKKGQALDWVVPVENK